VSLFWLLQTPTEEQVFVVLIDVKVVLLLLINFVIVKVVVVEGTEHIVDIAEELLESVVLLDNEGKNACNLGNLNERVSCDIGRFEGFCFLNFVY